MANWEYKTIDFDTKGFSGGLVDTAELNMELNRLGYEGWELVNCFTTSQSHGASRKLVAVFKRER